ncbi:hypothetical protein [Dietzia sp. ANT_WB102]|uniref:hypothetical protein n=1 Tax=Dietzia sp. ANT_WB102 TaxID=2597345 RepID=UPI0011ED83F0|nr:hypothetical protein [Dietzia sp. ANT_WB102]KAA0917007.1 hypothetical protein FQ137_12245 [Dietzia sp. ANT_WB102]
MTTSSTPNFQEALEAALHRPVTDSEVSRAYRLGHAAGRLLRRRIGPVPRSEYPDVAVALVVVRIVTRVVEVGGVKEVTDVDLRALVEVSASRRQPHPFTLA